MKSPLKSRQRSLFTETPIKHLWIVTHTGLCLASWPDTPTLQIAPNLISGFLSALRSFYNGTLHTELQQVILQDTRHHMLVRVFDQVIVAAHVAKSIHMPSTHFIQVEEIGTQFLNLFGDNLSEDSDLIFLKDYKSFQFQLDALIRSPFATLPNNNTTSSSNTNTNSTTKHKTTTTTTTQLNQNHNQNHNPKEIPI